MKTILALLIFLGGCASESRYLTKEQDDEFRATCAAAGCFIIPIPALEKFLRDLVDPGQGV